MSATAAEVEKSSTLPDSLRLIVLGNVRSRIFKLLNTFCLLYFSIHFYKLFSFFSSFVLFLGEILTATQWMLSIEGQVVLNQHPNFMAEFAALFATYYNFNLVYQHEASCTLEFVQR